MAVSWSRGGQKGVTTSDVRGKFGGPFLKEGSKQPELFLFLPTYPSSVCY